VEIDKYSLSFIGEEQERMNNKKEERRAYLTFFP